MDEHGLVPVVINLLVADDDGIWIVALAVLHCVLLLRQAGEPAGIVVALLDVAFLDLTDDGLKLLADFVDASLSQTQLLQPILQL